MNDTKIEMKGTKEQINKQEHEQRKGGRVYGEFSC